MNIAKKLALALAMALAASPVASAPAFDGATVTPTGAYTGTEHGAGTLSNGVVTITCTTSNFTATMQENGAFTVTALTFDSCEENLFLAECNVVVGSLPANGQIWFSSPRSTWGQGTAFEEATILCGGDTPVHCNASTTDTLGGTIANRTEPTESNTEPEFTVENGTVTMDLFSAQCGSTATWNASWTIDSPASYTIAGA